MKKCICLIFFICGCYPLAAQDSTTIAKLEDSLAQQKDLIDVIRNIFNKKPPPPKTELSTTAVLPALGYNPSIGFLLGINFVRSSYHGDPSKTKLSIAQLDFSYTTKKLIIARLRHNIFRANNTWNLQGNWQYMRNYVLDYGLGEESGKDPPVDYPIRFNYFRFTEKVYRKLSNTFFAGIGVSIDLRARIEDEKRDSGVLTPHYKYSIENDFNPEKYNVNGFILNFQYNSREHPNRSFGGVYADLNIRYNSKILGSTKESTQLYTEIRKYFSLSRKNPEHVLAVWYWGSYLLWGDLPYIELPGTAYDTYNRSGRGYTLGRFKGPEFAYGEVEYRIPISQVSKLFSAVVFANFQSASDGKRISIFERIDPGYGAGIRVQFNKRARTNICLDYARGRYGSSGIFFALNEAF
jgi:outer membrane protein assembly factor BamA